MTLPSRWTQAEIDAAKAWAEEIYNSPVFVEAREDFERWKAGQANAVRCEPSRWCNEDESCCYPDCNCEREQK